MSKKLAFIGISAITILGAGTAMADPQRLPGLVDRRPELPPVGQIQQQEAQVQQPKVDDYKGTNTPLPAVSTVVFNGPTVLNQQELGAISQPYLDRPITDNDIAQLKNAIADEYARRGYPLVKVTTPTQNLQNGQLTINIYEGHIGQVLTQSEGVIASYVPAAFAARLEGGIFDEKEAEGVVNDLNEINNTTSSITLRPGAKPLTTDVIVGVKDGGNQDTNFVAVDNYGSELTGEIVGSLHLEKTNAFKAGEKLTFDGHISDEKLYAGGVGISIPTGIRNTFFDASYLYSKNDIVDRLEFLDAEGESHIMNFGIHGNVISEDRQKLTLRAGLDVRNHESFLSGVTDTKDKIRRGYIGASYLAIEPEISTVFLLDGKLSKGLGIFGASEEGDAGITRANADPEAIMFEPSLYVRHDFTADDTITLASRGLISTNTLLSSDTFILGGYGSVRGFQPAQEVGDAGAIVNLEYQHKFPIDETFSVSIGPWLDAGRVWNRERNQTVDNALVSAGVGAQLNANIIPVGETKIRLDWAHPLGDYNSNLVEDNTYYFRVQQDF